MSVCVTALMGHNCNAFSRTELERAATAGLGKESSLQWLQYPTYKSPEEEYANDGIVSFTASEAFTIRFGKYLVGINQNVPWSLFLTDDQARSKVLEPLRRLCQVFGSEEILVVPQGSAIVDELYGGSTFQAVKAAAVRLWGPPDLFANKVYREDELVRMSRTRVHYFLVTPSDWGVPETKIVRIRDGSNPLSAASDNK